MAQQQKTFTYDTIQPDVKRVRYEVRGKVAIRANAIATEIKEAKNQGKKSPYAFENVIYCNIGNPQQLGQKPLTFFRQVLALVEYPPLLEHTEIFPADAIERAKFILAACGCPGATGAYSHSQGLPAVRVDVAKFIEERDGFACDPDSIFLTDGASPGVKLMLNLVVKDCASGVMIPIPQYPLYSATLALLGGRQVNYFLNEDDAWSLDVNELQRALREAQASGTEVRSLVVINPSNPTGRCLTDENIKEVIKFAARNGLVLMADEVYQENLYVPGAKFLSFRKAMMEMGAEAAGLQLVSFHSVSKGFVGECGKRGGYFQMEGIDKSVVTELYKMASINLCPNLVGQVVVDLMVRPPKKGQPSYELYESEKQAILTSLAKRANLLSDALNTLQGVKCTPPTASMYLFPQITLPKKAVQAALEQGETADTFYCLQLLESTGMCVVPGSGFGQRDGTFHFRTTFLPPENQIQNVVDLFRAFHNSFMSKYQ